MGLNLVKQQDDDDNYSIIDKIHLHVKDPYETKYQYPIKNREKKWYCNFERSKGFFFY